MTLIILTIEDLKFLEVFCSLNIVLNQLILHQEEPKIRVILSTQSIRMNLYCNLPAMLSICCVFSLCVCVVFLFIYPSGCILCLVRTLPTSFPELLSCLLCNFLVKRSAKHTNVSLINTRNCLSRLCCNQWGSPLL